MQIRNVNIKGIQLGFLIQSSSDLLIASGVFNVRRSTGHLYCPVPRTGSRRQKQLFEQMAAGEAILCSTDLGSKTGTKQDRDSKEKTK